MNQWVQKHGQIVQLGVPAALIVFAWLALWTAGWETVFFIFMMGAALWSGTSIAQEAWVRLRHRQFSIPFLITVASLGALLIGEVWEAAAVTFLYRFGHYLENLTLNRTRAALRDLIDLRPLTAFVADEGGSWQEIAADEVKPGQTVLVRPGGKVPVDGVIRVGQGSVDTAALTGEPLPREVAVGDEVLSGMIVVGGSIEVEAMRVAIDTTFNRLIRLVAQAQSEKPRLQRFIDRFAQWYTPAVMVTASLLFVWAQDVKLALTFLVIGCPGALIMAAPVAVVAGLGHGAKLGILIKGGDRLEQTGRLTTVAFDKTGTLTEGKPRVARIVSFGMDEKDILRAAATAEAPSEHHMASAIVEYAKGRGIVPEKADVWRFFPGMGVQARTQYGDVLVGNDRLLQQFDVDIKHLQKRGIAEAWTEGEALAYVSIDGRVVGFIGIEDTVRKEAYGLVQLLKSAGIRRTVMLTGDHLAAAQKVAATLGIDGVRANLLPEDKVTAIKQWQKEGDVVAMVGDGINDAPALATADVSIAMGTSGTQVAMESADIVLVEDRLDKIATAIQLSRRIMAIVKQNVVIAVSTVLLLLAGVVGRRVGLGLGMLMHEASILIVIANGMRLLKTSRRVEGGAAPERIRFA